MKNKKAILLDFYGTVVYEDYSVIDSICEQIKSNSNSNPSNQEIGYYWWDCFNTMCSNSFGEMFESQRMLELRSIEKTLGKFNANIDPVKVSQLLFDYWAKPPIFPESKEFLEKVELPVCVVSNIDRQDILQAIQHHNLDVTHIVTSEDARSYKPRSEIFRFALNKLSLTPDDVLHIGDSITSDILGAQSLGIRAVWINRHNKTRKNNILPDIECSNLCDLFKVEL